MKLSLIFSLAVVSVALMGCTNSQYSTVQTGPDRYTLSGPDPNRLQANAYKTCKDEGFVDYSVINSDKSRITVRCEKEPKSFFDTASETAGVVWKGVKKKVDELRQDHDDKKKNEDDSSAAPTSR